MVQPSRRFSLWSRLQQRFLVESLPAQMSETPGVLSTVQPITDADELLTNWGGVDASTISITAGLAGTFGVVTPGDGLRLLLVGYFIDRTGGDNNVDRIELFDRSENIVVRLDEFTAAAERLFFVPGQPIPLEEGDLLQLHTDGSGAAASVFRMRAWVGSQDAF